MYKLIQKKKKRKLFKGFYYRHKFIDNTLQKKKEKQEQKPICIKYK